MRLPSGPVQVRIGRPAPDAALRPSGILTAYNPLSRTVGPHANEAAGARLRRLVERLRVPFAPAVGVPDDPEMRKAWTEPGLALLGDVRPIVVALARRFGQNAVVWTDAEGRVRLVATRGGFGGCEVGEEVPEPAANESADRGARAR
ncbi:MAG: hypothetical protein JWM27_1639 [Gemmatimonadetes bacterium]|nr:hypothetical protein [Gemmatimonadota bacterium]